MMPLVRLRGTRRKGWGAATLVLVWFSLAIVPLGRAGLVPSEYERWQAYNGWRIRVIEFPGIQSFSRAELLTVMATEKPTWLRRYARIGNRTIFYANDFAADILRLEHFYAREGFPKSQVRGSVTPEERRHELKLKLEIAEGPPILLEGFRIVLGSDSGAGVDTVRWPALMPLKMGKRLAQSDVKVSADTLRYKLREIGHARARVEHATTVDSARHTAQVRFTLYPRHFCWIGETRITGLKQVSERTARRELTYREMDPFSPTKLEATRKRLVRLETFTFVSVQADTASPRDTLTIWIHTEEGSRYRLRLGGGYDTDERARAETEFTDLNFFGRARRFTLSGSFAELRRRGEARLFWPHTPWNATDVTLAPKWELTEGPGFILETQSATTILSASPLDKVTVSASNEIGAAHRRVVATDSVSNYLRSVETVSGAWDTRDNPLVARKGHIVGLTLAESGAFYRTELRWWRAILHGRVFVPATRFTILAGRSELGIMGPLHEARDTPVEERFYLGGPANVRGWNAKKRPLAPRANDPGRSPVGGDFAFSFTTEVRQNVWGPVTVAAFGDAGNVWKDVQTCRPLDMYPSVGLGLMFLTPVGPIRTDYAYQLRPNPFGEQRWSFDLTLGTPF